MGAYVPPFYGNDKNYWIRELKKAQEKNNTEKIDICKKELEKLI